MAHEAGEPIDRRDHGIGQGLGRDRDHVTGALLEASDLAGRAPDGPAHLPSDLLGNRLLLGDERIDGGGAHPGALGDACLSPRRLCRHGRR